MCPLNAYCAGLICWQSRWPQHGPHQSGLQGQACLPHSILKEGK